MSIEILGYSNGILSARIRGILTQPELAELQESAADIIRKHGKVSFLVVAEDFEGWQQGDDWSDIGFMENDPFIRKMAIVGERQWQELALIFAAQEMRTFPIEYFQPTDLDRARDWLAAD